MTPIRPSEATKMTAASRSRLLHHLMEVASAAADAQLEAFAAKLMEALLKSSNLDADTKEAGISFNAAHLLKKNSYPFRYTVSACLKKALQQEIDVIERPLLSHNHNAASDDTLTLVSYEEMDQKLTVGHASRQIEIENNDRFAALGIRLAYLLARDELPIAENPFRPEIFIYAINEAWSEFNPDVSSHPIVLPLLQPDVFLDLAPILQAVNDALVANDILREIPDRYSIKKSNTNQESTKKDSARDAAVKDQLTQLFSPSRNNLGMAADGNAQTQSFAGDLQSQVMQATAASQQLLGYLAGVQKSLAGHEQSADPDLGSHSASILPNIKKQAPQGALSQVDETTIDLLTKIFDVVFRDQNIPTEIKSLIGFLQVPLLKAALIDKDFFFKEEHPARRLIELLTKSSVDWDQQKGQDDPLFQTIKRNVTRVQQEYDQEAVLFSDVVSDIEAYLSQEDSACDAELSTPIAQALKQERIGQATKTAKQEVALRVGTGEVVAFVETFLENKWISVLTLAYSIKDEKPQAVAGAVKTMDDLIWSVKPKITREERKELISKLPAMLAMLNKWLNLVKLDDAERLQFFAELAECHASIVRAPLEISPKRQLEIAINAARQATERRLLRRANAEPEPEPDDHADAVQQLERGTWLAFTQKDDSIKKVKLAWISPLRSLFIFSTRDRLESFSLSAEELARNLREDRARIVVLGGLVGRALAEALDGTGVNDAALTAPSIAFA